MTREPFYPAQTESGSTYVMDGRFSPPRVASTVICSFDTSERWHIARLRARSMNDRHLRRHYRARRRLAGVALASLFAVAGIEIATGALSSFVRSVINAAL